MTQSKGRGERVMGRHDPYATYVTLGAEEERLKEILMTITGIVSQGGGEPNQGAVNEITMRLATVRTERDKARNEYNERIRNVRGKFIDAKEFAQRGDIERALYSLACAIELGHHLEEIENDDIGE